MAAADGQHGRLIGSGHARAISMMGGQYNKWYYKLRRCVDAVVFVEMSQQEAAPDEMSRLRQRPLLLMATHKLAAREHGTSTALRQQHEQQTNLIFTTKLKALQERVEESCTTAVSNQRRFDDIVVSNLLISVTACPTALIYNHHKHNEYEVYEEGIVINSTFTANFYSGLPNDALSRILSAMSDVSVAAARVLGATAYLFNFGNSKRLGNGIMTNDVTIKLAREDTLTASPIGDMLRSLRTSRNMLPFEGIKNRIVVHGTIPTLKAINEVMPVLGGASVHGYMLSQELQQRSQHCKVTGGGLGVGYQFELRLPAAHV